MASASEIQNIVITDAFTAHKPSKHIEYTIQVSTPTRTWSVNRRYNAFTALDTELRSATGKEPPAPLPPKHWFNRTMNDEEKIRQRRVGLEEYLRTVLTTKDSRWRAAYGFGDFLGVPSRNAVSTTFTTMTAASWLSEHTSVSGVLRSARASLLKRDALARTGDAASRSAGMEARKLLRDAGPRIDCLDQALETPALGNLLDGERRRRQDLITGLRTEHANLLRMTEAGVRRASPTSSSPASPSMPGSMPSGMSQLAPGRVFGRKAAPQETTETRPLDDRGLVQLQHSRMAEQDAQLTGLSSILRNQRVMGEEIATEINVQNEMLEHLDSEVTRVGTKMGRAKRQLNRLG